MASIRPRRSCAKKQPIYDDSDDCEGNKSEHDFDFQKTLNFPPSESHVKKISKRPRRKRIDDNDNIVDEEEQLDKQLLEAGVSLKELKNMTVEDKKQCVCATQQSKELFRIENEHVDIIEASGQDISSSVAGGDPSHAPSFTRKHTVPCRLRTCTTNFGEIDYRGLQGESNSLSSQYSKGHTVPLFQDKKKFSMLMPAAETLPSNMHLEVDQLEKDTSSYQLQLIKPAIKKSPSIASSVPVLSKDEDYGICEAYPISSGSMNIHQKQMTSALIVKSMPMPHFTLLPFNGPDILLQRTYVNDGYDRYPYSCMPDNNKEEYRKVILNKLSEWSRLHAEQLKSSIEIGADKLHVNPSKWHAVQFVKKQQPRDDAEKGEVFGGVENSSSRCRKSLKSNSMLSSTNIDSSTVQRVIDANDYETLDFNVLPAMSGVEQPVRQTRQADTYPIQSSPVDCSLPDIPSVSHFDGASEIGSFNCDLATKFATLKNPPTAFREVLNKAITVANYQQIIQTGKSRVKTSASTPAKNSTQHKKGNSKRKVQVKKNHQNQHKGKANVAASFTPHPLSTKNNVSLKLESPSAYSDVFYNPYNFPSIDTDSPLRHPGYLHLKNVDLSATNSSSERLFDEYNQKHKDQTGLIEKTKLYTALPSLTSQRKRTALKKETSKMQVDDLAPYSKGKSDSDNDYDYLPVIKLGKTYCKKRITLSKKTSTVEKKNTEHNKSSEDGEVEHYDLS